MKFLGRQGDVVERGYSETRRIKWVWKNLLSQQMYWRLFCVVKKSIEVFHQTNKRFLRIWRNIPMPFNMVKKNRDKDLATIAFSNRVWNKVFSDDVNFASVNLLVREQFDLLMNTDICKSILFGSLWVNHVYFPSVDSHRKRSWECWKNLYRNIGK